MQLLSVYRRVLSLLTTERSLALKLAGANAVIGLVQLAEPLLFGQVVDALARNKDDIKRLGIDVGDIIAIDPQPEFLDNGFIV